MVTPRNCEAATRARLDAVHFFFFFFFFFFFRAL